MQLLWQSSTFNSFVVSHAFYHGLNRFWKLCQVSNRPLKGRRDGTRFSPMSMNSWLAAVYRSHRALTSESTEGVGFPVVAKFTHIRTIRRRTVNALFPGRIGSGNDDTENKWKMSCQKEEKSFPSSNENFLISSTHIRMNSSIVICQQQQSFDHVERAIHAKFIVEDGLCLARSVISNSSVDSESEMRVRIELSPVESNSLRWMLAVKVNVSECLCHFVYLSLLCDGIQVERFGNVEVWVSNELVHDSVVDKKFSDHEQALDL